MQQVNAKIDVSVVLPAYNEESNISAAVKKTIKALSSLNCSSEIIVVDDGSTDNTAREVEEIITSEPKIHMIRHKINKGLTEALVTGFRQVRGDVIIFLCADLQSDPEEDIPKLFNEIKKDYDVVVGWRQGRKGNKVFLSKIYNFVCAKLFNLHIHDMNWIKAFKREVIEDFELRSDWHRFIPILVAHKGYKIGEIKTNWYPRKKGKSKFGFSRVPSAFFDLIVIKFLLIFMDKPIRFFGLWGILFISLGFLISIYLFLLWVTAHIQLRPLMLMSFFLILIGMFTLMIGFLAELIAMQQNKLSKIERQLKR